jgi:ATP-dependent helicase STH1/SNF2
LQGPNAQARIIDVAVKISKALSEQPESSRTVSSLVASSESSSSDRATVVKAEDSDASLDLSTGPFVEDDTNSGVYPYNAFVHPFTHFK